MGQGITSGVGTTPRISYQRGSTVSTSTSEKKSGQTAPNTQEEGKADDNDSKNAAGSDPLRELMDAAERMSKGVRSRLRPDNILVGGEVERWPPMGAADKAVDGEIRGAGFMMAAKRHVAKSLVNERRGLGNCGEMSTAVLRELVDYLLQHRRTARIDSIQQGDHEFVAIDPPKPGNGIYPGNFLDWPEDSIIVDPWMEIVCPAPGYPDAMRAKAAEWASQNKTIGTTVMVSKKNGGRDWVPKELSPQEFVDSILGKGGWTNTKSHELGSLEKLKTEMDLAIQWVDDLYAKAAKTSN
ncbi:hypothetical protein [Nannocystis punicea]|uniref:Uncharacterized protein n=1 Tax=Nannocystis punicea TaxID=2995304 RepID=A0ABY7H751_9BACT|nr:hypothetical protein [Nannocystis poenicansa]WAS95096.1 hypothetical protein O0S08_02955 [Nannocystis poenicansa]